ncbi:MAG: alpha/beta hydrolase fold domain-containing protein [Chthoniobacterales bacterium]|nr:alpha/beta hydrolase fold domain-containing protein [Chthoniobacterales bacterium]
MFTFVLTVEQLFQLAPADKFPAAHDDTWAAYQWTLQNAGKHGGDSKKVAVAGESAGGNMAASICLMAKQQGMQMPVHQLLIYPVADTATCSHTKRMPPRSRSAQKA